MNTHSKYLLTKISILVIALLAMSCSKAAVTPNSSGPNLATSSSPLAQASATLSPQPVASPSPLAGATPAISSPTPIAGKPDSAATPASPFEAQPGEKRQMMGNIPVVVSPAKPAMTPAPDPFPARPTPSVTIQNGKVVQQWQAPAEAAALVNPVKGQPNAVKIGHEIYLQKCVDCHGQEGKGNGYMSSLTKRDGKPLPPTNLASQMVQANTDGELFWKITNGKSPMPAHRIRFEDEQRWYIVAYLRSLKP